MLARLIFGLSLLAMSLSTQAQLFRAYLASYGNDANGCGVTAPCRLLPAALNAVVDGGEVWILDSANYNQGTVSFTKSVSVLAVPGQVGSVVAVNGNDAISISTPGVSVTLRNMVLAVNANSPGNNGLVVSGAGARVSIEDSVFSGFPNHGIQAVGSVRVHVKNSVFRNMGDYAIWAQDGATVGINGSQLVNNAYGIVAYTLANVGAPTEVNLADSEVAGPGTPTAIGVYALANGSTASIHIARSIVHGHDRGIYCVSNAANGTALVTLGGSTVTGNSKGIEQASSNGGSSICKSLGNNQIVDNATDVVGTLTTVPPR